LRLAAAVGDREGLRRRQTGPLARTLQPHTGRVDPLGSALDEHVEPVVAAVQRQGRRGGGTPGHDLTDDQDHSDDAGERQPHDQTTRTAHASSMRRGCRP
jgi:hypothetical protein